MVKVLLSLLVTTTLVVSVRGLTGQPLQTQAGDGPEAAAAPKVHAAARCTRSKVAGLLKSCFRTHEKGKRCLFDPAKDEARKHMLIREMCLCIVAEPGVSACKRVRSVHHCLWYMCTIVFLLFFHPKNQPHMH